MQDLAKGGRPPRNAAVRSLMAVSMVVFSGLAAMGLPLPALPVRMHDVLGFDMVTVGWVMAAQSFATLLTRPWAGKAVDRRGARRAVALGLLSMAGSGVAYGLATLGVADGWTSIAPIVIGRVFAGIGGGLIVTGGGAWAVGLAGPHRAGWAMSWIGLAMFAGLATGAAIGTFFELHGLAVLMVSAAAVGLSVAATVPDISVPRSSRGLGVVRVAGLIWRPGLALGLSSMGLAAVSSFAVLLFRARGWGGGGNAIALFGAGHVLARLLLARQPDRVAGPFLALALLAIEASGLIVLSVASTPQMAFLGATLAGFGFSMMYPLMAVPMFRNVPEHARGTAIGVYDAFYDVATGTAGIAFGLVAQDSGLPLTFLTAGGLVLVGGLVVVAAYR